MNALTTAPPPAEMPGLDRIRERFIELLSTRTEDIAQFALAALDGKTPDEIIANLEGARGILHQISGTAGTVGYPDLGMSAQQCEARIIAYLESPSSHKAVCPDEIIWLVDTFVERCSALTNQR